MKRSPFTLLFTVLPLAVAAQGKPFAAWLVDPAQSSGPSVQVWRDATTPHSFLWRLVAGNGALLAEMKQPPVPASFGVNFGDCKVAGVLRKDVLAIVRHSKKDEWSQEVNQLWVADAAAKAFVPHAPKGVVCRNEGYGV